MGLGGLSPCSCFANSAQWYNPMLLDLPNAVVYRRAGKATRALNKRNPPSTDCNGFSRSSYAFGAFIQMRPNRLELLYKDINFNHG